MSNLKEDIILKSGDVPGALLSKDPSQCNVVELRRWLECHGQKKSGKKQELVDRVKDCIALGLNVIDPKVDGGKWYDLKASNIQNNIQCGAGKNIPEAGWKTFPSTDIPSMFNYGHVYHYLVESISNAGFHEDNEEEESTGVDCEDTVTARPLKKGRQLLESGFVENIEDNIENEKYFVRAHIHHSMKNEKPLHVIITISNISGFIKQGSCTCRASTIERCAHISALLLMLSDHVKEEGHTVVTPCTSLPCQWNKGQKRKKEPKSLHEAKYNSSKRKDNGLYNWDPREPKYRKQVDLAAVSRFVINLQGSSVSMWETVLPITYSDFQIDMKDLQSYEYLRDDFVKHIREANLHILNNKISGEIPDTDLQQQSPKWLKERRYRITASKCKHITSLGEKLDSKLPLYNWLRNNLWFKEHITTIDMQYGIDNEANALRQYSEIKQVHVALSGLWLHRSFCHLGASPDGLVFNHNTKQLQGIVEIKCLKIFKERTIADTIRMFESGELRSIVGRQCFRIVAGNLMLKKTHMYYYQIQLQLLVTQAHYCDLVLYSNVGEPYIERITHDIDLQRRIVISTKAFWSRVMIPEYFIMRVPRKLMPVVL